MDKYVIGGGNRLEGRLAVQSAKNSILCLLSCSVMADGEVTIHKCPRISDVVNMVRILRQLGCKAEFSGDSLTIDPRGASETLVDGELTKSMRSSIFLMGPLAAKRGRAELCYPGGCDIGLRPIDLHIKGLRELGISVQDFGGKLIAERVNLRGTTVHLDYPSVGATENIIMAAALGKGRTVVKNAAKEPEITDLQNFIVSMGGKVYGAGTGTVIVEGVENLHGTEFTPIGDRIVAGTYMTAAAITGGRLEICGVSEEHIYSLIVKLRESACKITAESDKIYIEAPRRCKAARIIETSPYPGFPTDLQAQMLALQAVSEGTCILQENLFETRFKHVGELLKMGANVTLRGKIAVITGVEKLHGASITAHDLRGGAALVLAGLAADGVTTVEDVYHIERGYEDLVGDLKSVGADIETVK